MFLNPQGPYSLANVSHSKSYNLEETIAMFPLRGEMKKEMDTEDVFVLSFSPNHVL